MINPDIILAFDGNHADIPSGFSRETALDGKFPKGWGTENPNITGGNATHTHTSPSHSHNISNHSHSIQTTDDKHETSAETGACNVHCELYNGTHHHTGTISTLDSVSVSSATVTYSAQSNNPPYYDVIFIKSNGYNFIPDKGIVLSNATTREGLTFHTASADKFLRGADTEQNAGSTGGSVTNSHSINHTHSTSHKHIGRTGTPNTGGGPYNAEGTGTPKGQGMAHTHNVVLNAKSLTSSDNSSIGDQSETVQPAFRTLNAFLNDSGNSVLPKKGDIALFLGSVDNIPVGWKLCNGDDGTPDMRDRFLKIPASASSSTTGGSNTHTHAAQSHTHNLASHNHTGYIPASSDYHNSGGSGHHYWVQNVSNAHTLAAVSSSSATLTSSNTTADSADNQPEYRTVVYIQMEFSALGGAAFFMNLL